MLLVISDLWVEWWLKLVEIVLVICGSWVFRVVCRCCRLFWCWFSDG